MYKLNTNRRLSSIHKFIYAFYSSGKVELYKEYYRLCNNNYTYDRITYFSFVTFFYVNIFYKKKQKINNILFNNNMIMRFKKLIYKRISDKIKKNYS